MLGQALVTHQTGAAGRVVNKVLVAESAQIAREIYLAILLDRATAAPLIVGSTEGGVEIEAVAAKSPEKMIRQSIDPLAGLQPFQTRKLAKQLQFESSQLKAASKLFDGLYRAFIGLDCSMVEVNPLIVTPKGEVLALDAKFNFDDNALYRHPEIAALRDVAQEDPAKSKHQNTGSITSDSTETLHAWSTAQGWRWPRWTSSSFTAASRPISSTSAAAPTNSRSPKRSKFCSRTKR